jgi:hypothetical protein
MCPVRSVTYVSGRSFIHLVNFRIWRVAHTRGIYRGPLVNFAFCWLANGLNGAAEILKAEVPITSAHADHRRRGPSNDLGYLGDGHPSI